MTPRAGDLTREQYAYWRRQAAWVARQVVPTYPVDDMIAEGMLSLVKSLRSHKPDSRVSLGGHVLNHMRWAMLDAARRMRTSSRLDTSKGIFYDEVPLDDARDAAVAPTVNTGRLDLAAALAKLPAKRRAFMQAYLRLGDVALAAEEVGCTRESGWQHHWQAVRALRKMLAAPWRC